MTAIRTGVSAAIASYQETAIAPTSGPLATGNWNKYAYRLQRYAIMEAYYHNTMFSDLNAWLTTLKVRYGLYKHIRSIYNPVGRLVDLDVSKIYGGSINMQTLDGGAIPVAGADEKLVKALIQIMQWSNWQTAKSLYTRYGAMLGDTAIKIVDDRQRRKTRMEVLHPGKLQEVTLDAVGNVKAATIQYEDSYIQPETGREVTYTYTELIDKSEFVTLRDGEEYPFYEDAEGNPISRWRNEYGFVPLVLVKHLDMGQDWGGNAFYKALTKINEVNDLASNLHDQIRKAVNPIWFASGFAAGKKVERDPDAKKDDLLVLYGPADSKLEALVANLDIGGALAAVDKALMEVERSVPELAIEQASDLGTVSGVAVRNMFTGAVGLIEEFRGNYDSGLIRALQMAVAIGGYRGYDNLTGFTLDSYGRHDLDFYIKERPVFDDGLTEEQHFSVLSEIKDDPPAVARLKMERLGYAPDKIKAVLLELQTAQEVSTPAQITAGDTPAPVNQENAPPVSEEPVMSEERFARLASIWEKVGISEALGVTTK